MSEQQQDTAKYVVGDDEIVYRLISSPAGYQTYLSGIIDQVVKKDSRKDQEQMVKESLTKAFDEFHSGKSHHDAHNLFKK